MPPPDSPVTSMRGDLGLRLLHVGLQRLRLLHHVADVAFHRTLRRIYSVGRTESGVHRRAEHVAHRAHVRIVLDRCARLLSRDRRAAAFVLACERLQRAVGN